MNLPWIVTRCANGVLEIEDGKGNLALYLTDETPDELQGQGHWENEIRQWLEVVAVLNALDRPLKSQEIQCAALAYGPHSFPTNIKDALECYRTAVLGEARAALAKAEVKG